MEHNPRQTDPRPQTVTIFGSRVQYWEYGDPQGTVLLMVHGFRGNHHGLRDVFEHLPRFRVIVPDLPGYGASSPMTELPHGVGGYAAFVEAFITRLRLHQPVLLGHSFGSIVAAHVAANRPDLIAKLILVNPIATRPGQTWLQKPASKLVEAYYWLSLRLPEGMGQRAMKSRSWARLLSLTLARSRHRPTRRKVYAHHFADLDYYQNRRVIAESFADSITKTVLDDAARIHMRTLLIAGERDNIAPLPGQRRLHRALAQGEIVVAPKQGHLIHLEQPQSVVAAIEQFMN